MALKRFAIKVAVTLVVALGLSLAASGSTKAERLYHRMKDSVVISVPDSIAKAPKGHQTKEQWQAKKKNPEGK
jgi:hypothetical protein